MLTEIEQKVLYKVLKEEPFSELEIELMNRMLYLDEEIRHEVDKRNEVEEQLADLFKETRKNMKEVKKSLPIQNRSSSTRSLRKSMKPAGMPNVDNCSMRLTTAPCLVKYQH